MTVTYTRIGTGAGSISGASFTGTGFPAPAVNQGMLVVVGWGNSTNSPPTVDAALYPGYTRIGEIFGGSGVWGAGTGPRGVTFFWKVATGTETDLVVQHGNTTDANRVIWGYVFHATRSLGFWKTPLFSGGVDTNISTSMATEGMSAITQAAIGDHVVIAGATVPSASSPAYSLAWGTGITGAVANRLTGQSTTGHDVRVNVASKDVPAASTGTPSITSGTVGAGAFGLVLLRDTSTDPNPPGTIAGVMPTINAGADISLDSWGAFDLTATSSKSEVTWGQVTGAIAPMTKTGALTLASTEAPPGIVEQSLVFRASASDPNGANPLSGFSISGGHLIGMNATDLARTMKFIADAGAKYIRWGFTGFEIELTPGVRGWSGHDRVVAAARAAGLSIIGLLTSLPRWANTTNTGGSYGDGCITQAQRDAFTSFAVAAATRYVNDITVWEIWNEANSGSYWAPEMTTAADYVLLLKQVYPAIKAASPSSKIITTGCARPRILTSAAFYTSVYANGGKDYFDYCGMHPYPNSGTNPNTGEMSLLDNLIAVLDANGDNTKPIWGTECGMATAGGGSVTYAQHGALWKDLNDFWFANIGAHLGPLVMYSGRDKQLPPSMRPVGTTIDREDYFGSLDLLWRPKPSYFALQERNKAQGATVAYDDVTVKVLPASRATISGKPIRRLTLR